MPSPRIQFCFFATVALATAGCASWQEEPTAAEPFSLPKTRLSRDAVVLDIRFVSLTSDGETEESLDEIWQEFDEEHLDLSLRKRLARNGFRAGVFGEQLPAKLRELLTEDVSFTDANGKNETIEMAPRRLQARARKKHEINAGDARDSFSVFVNASDEVRGETFQNAQCLFGLRSYPLGDGRVRVELTPEIHHGEPRQKWASGNGVFQYVATREQEEYGDLAAVATLSPGETMAVTSSRSPKGLGKSFFWEDGSDADQRMLLIRLSQTQWDNLFDPQPIDEPLATSERE